MTPREKREKRAKLAEARRKAHELEEPLTPEEDILVDAEGNRETLEEWNTRKDEEEGRPHDANESRQPESQWLEEYDPWMGVN